MLPTLERFVKRDTFEANERRTWWRRRFKRRSYCWLGGTSKKDSTAYLAPVQVCVESEEAG